ncbi:MAG: energy transducer TonB [Burkholderiales bacterium]
MADVVLPVSGHKPAPTSAFPRLRLAVALSVSALVHVWLAAAVRVEAPTRRMPLQVSAAITARLEQPRAIPETTVFPQDENGTARAARAARRHGHGERESVPAAPGTGAAAAVPEISGMTSGARRRPSPLADPNYYPARQLDAYPALSQPVNLDYPERAALDKVGGKVLVLLLIDETGGVDEVTIVESAPRGYFEEPVRRAFADARFSPAHKDGRAVKSRVMISVDYHPGEAEGKMR